MKDDVIGVKGDPKYANKGADSAAAKPAPKKNDGRLISTVTSCWRMVIEHSRRLNPRP